MADSRTILEILKKPGADLYSYFATSLGSFTADEGLGRALNEGAERAAKNPNLRDSFYLFHKRVHVLLEPSQVQQFMRNEAVGNEDIVKIYEEVFGRDNIFDSDVRTPAWEKHRHPLQARFLTARGLNEMTPTIHHLVSKYMDEMSSREINIQDLASCFTMDVIASQLGIANISHDTKRELFPIISKMIKKLINPLNSIEARLPKRLTNFAYDTWSALTGSLAQSIDEIMEPANRILRQVIQANEANILGTKNWLTTVTIKNIWCARRTTQESTAEQVRQIEVEYEQALQSKTQEINDILYSEEARHAIRLFLVAGHETTSKFFQFMLTLLTDEKHKTILEKLREEMKKFPEKLTRDDVERFTLLRAIAFETLRLFPSIPEIKAEACENMKDLGIRKGDIVIVSPFQTQRSTQVYGEDAAEFRPNRFINADGSLKKPDPNIWFSFGFGSRMCVGRELVMLEIFNIMTAMLRKFDIVIDDERRYDVSHAFSLQPQAVISGRFTERSEVRAETTCRPGRGSG